MPFPDDTPEQVQIDHMGPDCEVPDEISNEVGQVEIESEEEPEVKLGRGRPKIQKTISSYMSKIGKKGGKRTSRHGSDYYRAIGKKGLSTRWGEYL